MKSFQGTLAWADTNERHLGAFVFVLGFATDLLTFGRLEINVVNWLFIGYLVSTAFATLASHYLYSHEREDERVSRKVAKVGFPLLAQYSIGSLLSGTLIFYGKSSTFFVSWPFLLLLIAIFFGNEFFRRYKARLTFQAVLFFFTLYAYVLFALPLSLHTLGRSTFLLSTGVSIAGFLLFLWALYAVGKKRFLESFKLIIISSSMLVFGIVGSYFTGVLPPLPLTLKDSGVYHSVVRTEGSYVVTAEQEETWQTRLLPRTVHLVPGKPLYGYSSVFAPGAFTTDIIHVWERYDSAKKKWREVSRVAFTLSGGRNGGYRGYSEISSPQQGLWRLSVRTNSNQVIGRVRFTVVTVPTDPALITETK